MKHKKFIKNIKQRKLYSKSELFRKVLKTLFLFLKTNFLKLILKKKGYFFLFKFFFRSYLKNFCLFSGRSRSVYGKLKVSRLALKFLGEQGLFFGLQKVS